MIKINVKYAEKRRLKEKEYEILIVPNKFNHDYSEYFKAYKEIINITKDIENAETIEDREEISNRLDSMDLSNILEMKYNLIKTIMTANDYEYDREWWDTRVNPSEIDKFITECVLKDKPDDVKKKLLKSVTLIMGG
jgi:hypothetical protein